ncbi:unnamed protein product [Effrenium voratum]|uniref:Uncharacterized protein n=1 Tax=Effrenium voratum TaxID=2562239 RepID=A0AA36IIT9_9DINO|nr:unnamed protein product [Effrenium voratum]
MKVPLRVRRLRRLAFEGGATRKGVLLAELSAAKGRRWRSPLLQELLLDVSELLNLRAYARTYVSSRPRMVLELEEAR